MAEVTGKKKRNPQDATLRNTRAANKKLEALQQEHINLAQSQSILSSQMVDLRQRIERLEKTAHLPDFKR